MKISLKPKIRNLINPVLNNNLLIVGPNKPSFMGNVIATHPSVNFTTNKIHVISTS